MDSAVLLRASLALALVTGAMSVPAADDPTDPAAPASADRFRSAFADYHAYEQSVRPPWRDALQEVAPRSGSDESHENHHGHEGHQSAEPATPLPPPADHSHHQHQ
jgi:hypothetical protein